MAANIMCHVVRSIAVVHSVRLHERQEGANYKFDGWCSYDMLQDCVSRVPRLEQSL